ncbi:MAG: DUF4366 domain-containing protein [Clostridiales bacterium]|nr:DUF4366 domain-containing protein [Clostridiales bacterium]
MKSNKIVACLMAVFLSVGVFTTGACAYVEGDVNADAVSEDTSVVAEEESEEVATFEDSTNANAYDESEEQTDAETTTLTGTVNVSDHLNLRTGASTDDEVIGHLLPGTTVEIIGEEDGWYQVIVSEQIGYVCGDYLEVAESTAQATGESTEEETNSVDEETLLALYESLLQSADSDSSSSLSLTPEGNLTLVDNITDTASGKQFITVCTKSGNYFYLIIDEDDEGESTVHFLNQVDEADLLALMDEDEAAEYEESLYGTDTEEIEEDTSEADASALEDEEPEETEEKSDGVNLLPVVLLVVLLAAGGGFFAYTQVMNKKKEKTRPDPDADYVDETGDEGYDFPDAYDEDDGPV